MVQKKLKELREGEFFTLNDHGDEPDEKYVYIRGDYERSEKKYEVSKFSDINDSRFLRGDRLVYVGFTF